MPGAAVLYVKDLDGLRAFYERCFGLAPVASDPGRFAVLAAGDTELTLVTVPNDVGRSIAIDDPPRRRSSTPIKLVFDVDRIDGVATAVAATGGQIDPPDAAWTFRGRRHLDAVDPEGNVVQLRERLDVRPDGEAAAAS